jgi:beta-1,4-glucosyltransferase
VVLVGLGAVRQERWALAVRRRLQTGLVMTCGGFFDQLGLERPYYPAWAYPLRLNWAVRLVREPRRLWHRYTVEAMQAVAGREAFRDGVTRLPGYAAHRAAVTGGPPAPD